MRRTLRDTVPVAIMIAVGLLDGIDGPTGLAVAAAAYAVALVACVLLWARHEPDARATAQPSD